MILLLFSTDFPRTHLRTFKKVRENPFQNFFSLKISTSFFVTQYVSIVVSVGLKPSIPTKTTFPPHVGLLTKGNYTLTILAQR